MKIGKNGVDAFIDGDKDGRKRRDHSDNYDRISSYQNRNVNNHSNLIDRWKQ